jgi:hypothetical protein
MGKVTSEDFLHGGMDSRVPKYWKTWIKYGPKVGQKLVRANTSNPENTDIQANRLSSRAKKGTQNGAQKWH